MGNGPVVPPFSHLALMVFPASGATLTARGGCPAQARRPGQLGWRSYPGPLGEGWHSLEEDDGARPDHFDRGGGDTQGQALLAAPVAAAGLRCQPAGPCAVRAHRRPFRPGGGPFVPDGQYGSTLTWVMRIPFSALVRSSRATLSWPSPIPCSPCPAGAAAPHLTRHAPVNCRTDASVLQGQRNKLLIAASTSCWRT